MSVSFLFPKLVLVSKGLEAYSDPSQNTEIPLVVYDVSFSVFATQQFPDIIRIFIGFSEDDKR